MFNVTPYIVVLVQQRHTVVTNVSMSVARIGLIVVSAGERPARLCGSVVEYLSLFALCTSVALCSVLLLDLCIASSVSLRRHASSFGESYQLTKEVALSPTSFIFQNIQLRHSYTLLGNLGHIQFDEF
jgi:hypothetical protein